MTKIKVAFYKINFLYCLTNIHFCILAFLVIIFTRHLITNATDLKGHQVTKQIWKNNHFYCLAFYRWKKQKWTHMSDRKTRVKETIWKT